MRLSLDHFKMGNFTLEPSIFDSLGYAHVKIEFTGAVFYETNSVGVGFYALVTLLDHAKSMLAGTERIFLAKPDEIGSLQFTKIDDDCWEVEDCEGKIEMAKVTTEEMIEEVARFAVLVARLISYHHGAISPEALLPSGMPDALQKRIDNALASPLPPFGKRRIAVVNDPTVGWIIGSNEQGSGKP